MRRTIVGLGIALFLIVPAATARADNEVVMTPDAKKSVEKALAWLKSTQETNGSWSGSMANTSFALLAFMSYGNVPNQGLYGTEVSKGVRFLLSQVRSDGYLAGRGGNMYSHGIATLALSQAYGMTGDENVRKVLDRAVKLIIKTQNREGGWRYNPAPNDADISATIMQVMALRGAKDGGIHVPNETLAQAVKYIGSCRDPRSGGYCYQAGRNNDPGFARTAAGVCVLQLSGDYDAKEIAQAVEYMDKSEYDRSHYWYGHYYAAHAYHQVGGEKWAKYYESMTTLLLKEQDTNGSWRRPDRGGHNDLTYRTAISILVLTVPANYLPIYQS